MLKKITKPEWLTTDKDTLRNDTIIRNTEGAV